MSSSTTRIAPAVLALLVGALAGCRTETSVSPAAAEPGVISHARAARAWRVLDADRLAGWVVRFDDPLDPARSFFSVRDASHHDLGLIDLQGRAFRFHPHAREAQWLGSGTVEEGARRILDASEEAHLVEEPAAAAALEPAGG